MKKLVLLLTGIFCMALLPAHAASLSLKSTNFTNGSTIPTVHTCDGKNTSPQLHWTGISKKAKSLALIVSDPDAPSGTFYHWVLYNLPKDTKLLAEGIDSLPKGTLVGKNSAHKLKYKGPCPPKKSKHTYIFTLYVLDTLLKLDSGATADEVTQSMNDHIIEQAELRGVFGH